MFQNNTQNESIKVSNTHIWVAANGTSVASLVVQNTGNTPVSVHSVTVRGVAVPFGSWYYNIADATPTDVLRELRPDFSLNAVDVTGSAPEEAFVQSTGAVSLMQGQAVIIYLANPSAINMMDAGIDYNVNVKAGKASASIASVHVTAG